MKLNTLNVSIFSLILKDRGVDMDRLKETLENTATAHKNVYLQGEAYVMGNCFYYLESSGDKLHIATRYNKYPDIETLIKKDVLIAFLIALFRSRPQSFNIKFGKIEVLWPQWKEKPGFVLAKYLCGKDNEC